MRYENLIRVASCNGGIQKIYRFANNYGASVVRHYFSYGNENGLWELAVIKFVGEDWEIDYDTNITDDVLGYLDDAAVDVVLSQIEIINSLICPMCGGIMISITPDGAGTNAYSCLECPAVLVEYYDKHDLDELSDYIHGRTL